MEDYDWEQVDATAQDAQELILPRITWLNGKRNLKGAGGIAYTGGMTARRLSLGPDATIENWTVGGFDADGKTIETLETPHPVIAPIRYRRRWAQFDGNVLTHWVPITEPHRPGYKIQLEIAGFIRGWDQPVRFDLRGYASSGLLDAMREHATHIVAEANRHAPAGRALPPYAFWLRVQAGEHKLVGKGRQSDATVPQLVRPAEITADYTQKLYVGKEWLCRFQAFYHEIDHWTQEWGARHLSAGADERNDLVANGHRTTEDMLDTPVEDIPF